MSKYEIENLKQIYLYNNVKETKGLCFPKNELAITEVLDAFCDCISFERPDGYCIYKETLYLFEHFAIDSSVNDKGSSYMRQKHREDNLYEKFKVSEKLNKVQMITVEESFEDYIKNFRNIVKKHYLKISEYKENVLNFIDNKFFKEIKIVFVGEKSLFGKHKFKYLVSMVPSHKLAVIITSGSSICNSRSKKFVFSKSESSKKR